MKKTVKLPDGREEVFEGTAEEIAELERRLREEGVQPTKGRRILNEGEKLATDDLATCPCKTCESLRKVNETLEKWPKLAPWIDPIPMTDPYPNWPKYPPYKIGDRTWEALPIWRPYYDILCNNGIPMDIRWGNFEWKGIKNDA
jgi:hypothetical protein